MPVSHGVYHANDVAFPVTLLNHDTTVAVNLRIVSFLTIVVDMVDT